MLFSAFVTTITQDKFFPKVTDNILKGNVLLERFLGNAKPWGSGHIYRVPVKYQKSTAGGSYEGFDTFSTSQMNTRVLASYSPMQNYFSVVVAGIQRAVNKGEAAVVDLLATEMDSVADDMRDGLGTQFYSDGTGNSSKDIDGLALTISSSATLGGLDVASYSTWASDLDSDAEPLSLADLRQSLTDATVGDKSPTMVVTTPTLWQKLESLMQANLQYHTQVQGYPRINRFTTRGKGGQVGDTGFDSIYVRGIPVVKDDKCTSTYIYNINEENIWFATIPHPDYPTMSNGIAWTGLKEPTNQDAKVGQFLLYGNFICNSRRTSSYLTGKTA